MPSLKGLSEYLNPTQRVSCACWCLCAVAVNRYGEPCIICKLNGPYAHATYRPRTRHSK